MLASVSWDTTAKLWDPATGRLLGPTYRDARQIPMSGAFSPDGKYLAIGTGEGSVRLWQPDNGQVVTWPRLHGGVVPGLAFSHDGKLLVTGAWDHTARLWTFPGGKMHRRPLQHRGNVLAVAFHPKGLLVATGSADKTACLWEPVTGLAASPFLHHPGVVKALAFHPDGLLLATGWDGNRKGGVEIWKVPRPPVRLRDLEQLTWLCLGCRRTAHGTVEIIPYQEWQRLRKELLNRGLLDMPAVEAVSRRGDE